MKAIIDFFKADKFRTIFIGLMLLTFAVLLQAKTPNIMANDTAAQKIGTEEVEIFYSPTCPHCHKAFAFLETIKGDFPNFKFNLHDITQRGEAILMAGYGEQFGIPENELGTPLIVYKDKYILGFGSAETSGQEMIAMFNSGKKAEQKATIEAGKEPAKDYIDLPIFGKVSLVNTSLPVLAVVIGLVDGFNPCAMWVLVYLISIIVELKSRDKIFLIVGTFLAASAILYFLFMTAWLNLFLFIGYVRPIMLFIGLFAVYFGVMSLYDYIKSRGHLECDLVDFKTQQKTKTRIKDLVSSPLSVATFFGIVVLAFAVNSVEFLCSSALPAVFTQVLAVADVGEVSHYLYILLYLLFFMLDDLIIFTLAAVAVNKFVGDKYASLCKAIGGTIMVLLGVVMTFFPELLR